MVFLEFLIKKGFCNNIVFSFGSSFFFLNKKWTYNWVEYVKVIG